MDLACNQLNSLVPPSVHVSNHVSSSQRGTELSVTEHITCFNDLWSSTKQDHGNQPCWQEQDSNSGNGTRFALRSKGLTQLLVKTLAFCDLNSRLGKTQHVLGKELREPPEAEKDTLICCEVWEARLCVA